MEANISISQAGQWYDKLAARGDEKFNGNHSGGNRESGGATREDQALISVLSLIVSLQPSTWDQRRNRDGGQEGLWRVILIQFPAPSFSAY